MRPIRKKKLRKIAPESSGQQQEWKSGELSQHLCPVHPQHQGQAPRRESFPPDRATQLQASSRPRIPRLLRKAMLRKKHTKSNKYKHEHSMKQFNRANKTLVIINNLRDVTEYYNHNSKWFLKNQLLSLKNYPHFTSEKTEAQRCSSNVPWSRSW